MSKQKQLPSPRLFHIPLLDSKHSGWAGPSFFWLVFQPLVSDFPARLTPSPSTQLARVGKPHDPLWLSSCLTLHPHFPTPHPRIINHQILFFWSRKEQLHFFARQRGPQRADALKVKCSDLEAVVRSFIVKIERGGCDQLMDILRIGWWWGKWESSSSTFGFQPVLGGGLYACGQHIVNFTWSTTKFYRLHSLKATHPAALSIPTSMNLFQAFIFP